MKNQQERTDTEVEAVSLRHRIRRLLRIYYINLAMMIVSIVVTVIWPNVVSMSLFFVLLLANALTFRRVTALDSKADQLSTKEPDND